jgi:hypothetical protein
MRALLALALFAPTLAAPSLVREWRFRVLLDEREVGSHVFSVVERDGERWVASDAQFTVRFLFLDAYRYVHTARERWDGDCLTAIESHTDDNGKQLTVRGMRTGGQFEVATVSGPAELPGCVMSFAYWNPAILRQARLLNAQNGALVDVRVEPLGEEAVLVRGSAVLARRYALHAPDFRIDVWYAAGRDWVQLESRTGGGRLLRYLIQ